MSVPFNKFSPFATDVYHKKHDFSSDTLKIALLAAANPPAAANGVLADLTQISYTNCSSRTISTTSSSGSLGVHRVILGDLTLTASGGSIASFRYIVLYNDTATNDELIGWWDYGASVTIVDGQDFIIDTDQVNGILTHS